MDASDSAERTRLNVLELARNLYSHDAELLDGAISKSFASNATYAGHGLKISGASRIKHAAQLNNAIDVGSAPELSAEDVEWDESSKTATLSTVRYVSPRGVPLFSFAIPVRTTLHFGGPDKSLQVTHIAEEWPLDAFLQRTPVVGTVERTIFTPLATLAFVQLAGLYHALSSHVSHTSRKLVEPTAKAAKARVPAGVERGFVRGTEVAQGWGSGLVERAVNLSEAPLRALERAAQTSTSLLSRVSPIELPTPFIYQAPERKRPAPSKKSGSKKEEKAEEKPAEAKPQQDVSAEEQPAAATVQVSATADEPAREISIPARVHNEAPQAEATTQLDEPQKPDGAPKETLFDRIEVPDLTTGHAASQKPQGHLLAVPPSPNLAGGHSSGSEEEHEHEAEHDDEERKTGGAAKKKHRSKKNRKNKKDKEAAAAAPAAAHEKPPTFKESLQS